MNETLTTAYSEWLSTTLRPREASRYSVLDLFAGCGGLALGFEAAGFSTLGVEMDASAASTYRNNLLGDCIEEVLTAGTPLPSADVIVGGPPCQPFSVSGSQAGRADTRNGFPAFISAVARIRPRLFLFENVRGMLYRNKDYYRAVLSELSSLGYRLEEALLNAVDYQVPQNRERVVVVGHRAEFAFPTRRASRTTVSQALGGFMSHAPDDARYLTPNQDAYIARYEAKSGCVRPRDLHPEIPARTLTCRNLGGATSDMHRLLLPDGRRRRLLVREAARLQSFPDWFEFGGGEASQFKQIGNSVAPLFALRLAESVAACLDGTPLPNTERELALF